VWGHTQGNTWRVAYDVSGTPSGTSTQEYTVNGPGSFNGTAAVEVQLHTVHSFTTSGVDQTIKTYEVVNSPTQLTRYGELVADTITGSFGTTTNSGTTTYSPPWVDASAGLAIGASLSESYTYSSTVTSSTNGAPPTTATQGGTNALVIKFAAIESVTVPAGTYTACRQETYASGATPSAIAWVVQGKVPVKIQTPTGVFQATSVTINGVAQ
jgi:hypothetical protein